MDIILIAAMAANRVIGRNNATPWHIPEELHFFKRTTMGHPVIMGRKTYSSLPGPLPGRRNIIISRTPGQPPEGTEAVATLPAALALCRENDRVFVIGGAQIFTLALPHATTIMLSVLDADFDGDTYFPDFSDTDFIEMNRQRHEASLPFTIVTYRRR
jgi:dihydrofolate reductase